MNDEPTNENESDKEIINEVNSDTVKQKFGIFCSWLNIYSHQLTVIITGLMFLCGVVALSHQRCTYIEEKRDENYRALISELIYLELLQTQQSELLANKNKIKNGEGNEIEKIEKELNEIIQKKYDKRVNALYLSIKSSDFLNEDQQNSIYKIIKEGFVDPYKIKVVLLCITKEKEKVVYKYLKKRYINDKKLHEILNYVSSPEGCKNIDKFLENPDCIDGSTKTQCTVD